MVRLLSVALSQGLGHLPPTLSEACGGGSEVGTVGSARLHACMYVCMYVCIYVCVYVCMYVRVFKDYNGFLVTIIVF